MCQKRRAESWTSRACLTACLALLALPASGVRAEPSAPSAAPAAGESVGEAASSPATADQDAGAEPADAALEPEPTAAPGPTRQALLQAAVFAAEREQPHVVIPWIVTGLGVAVFATGAVIGAVNAGGCDGSCSTAGIWPWAIIAGCTISAGGSIWLVLALRDQAEARDRLERARKELELDRIDRGAPPAAAMPALTLRARF